PRPLSPASDEQTARNHRTRGDRRRYPRGLRTRAARRRQAPYRPSPRRSRPKGAAEPKIALHSAPPFAPGRLEGNREMTMTTPKDDSFASMFEAAPKAGFARRVRQGDVLDLEVVRVGTDTVLVA